jgi:hypothetical protein
MARRNEWAEKRARIVDLCPTGGRGISGKDGNGLLRPFELGKDTLFVNSAIVDIAYKPRHIPWLVDLELPRANADDVSRAKETAAVLQRAEKEAELVAASVGGGPAPADR